MKKQIIKIGVVAVLIVGFFIIKSCKPRPIDGDRKEKSNMPRNLISVLEAQEMQNRYVDTREKVLEGHLGFKDNRDFAITIAEMERYLKYVNRELKLKKSDKEEVYLRFYLSAYSQEDLKKYKIVDNPEKYKEKGYTTVFMAPDQTSIQTGSIMPVKPYFAVQPGNRYLSGEPAVDF